MHFKSLRHVRDHVKVQGRPYELLTHIALHTNMHTGEAFELSVERQAHRHAITPEWTRRLLNGLIATGELIVERSRGRYPNRYRFPLERCPACQGDAINPEVELGDAINPERQPQTQPQTLPPPTPNSAAPQPVGKVLRFPGVQPQTPAQKEVKELKEKKDGPTPNVDHDHVDRPQDAPTAPLGVDINAKLPPPSNGLALDKLESQEPVLVCRLRRGNPILRAPHGVPRGPLAIAEDVDPSHRGSLGRKPCGILINIGNNSRTAAPSAWRAQAGHLTSH